MLQRILHIAPILLYLSLASLSLQAQGKAMPRVDDKEKEAKALYAEGNYREACDILLQTTEARKGIEDNRIAHGLFFFMLLNITGVFFFLWIEKRKAYKLLVDKNAEEAKKPVINSFTFSFDGTPDTEEVDRQLLHHLQELLEVEGVYKEPGITVAELAQRMNVTRADLSRVVNQQLHCSFPALLNQYRVREAIRLLTDSSTTSYKLEAIGDLCGYNNRQVFHAAFKKETGLTPLEFRKAAQSHD
ncbi:MAG: AraC family transcriptional regulator [Prevotellaceae bacterium]|nr:AraC family transcriptional regulator [Prevotellaceae bacterium]